MSKRLKVDVDGWWMLAMTISFSCAATVLRYFITSRLAAESSPLVGSSRKRIFGDVMSWLAMPTRLFCPPLIPFRIGVPMIVLACACSPNDSKRPSILAMRCFFCRALVLDSLDAKSSVSRTVRDPISASSCSTKRLICLSVVFEGAVPLIRT